MGEHYRNRKVDINLDAPEHEKFIKIVRHACPNVAMDKIQNFTAVMLLKDFCFSPSEVREGELAHEEAVMEKLKDGLVKLSDNLLEQFEELEEKREEVKILEREIKQAKQPVDGESTSEKKDREAGYRSSTKEKIRLQKEILKLDVAFKKDLNKEFRGELEICKRVMSEISTAYERILLANGLQDVRLHLSHLFSVFQGGIKDFRKRADSVSNEYSKAKLLPAPQFLAIAN